MSHGHSGDSRPACQCATGRNAGHPRREMRGSGLLRARGSTRAAGASISFRTDSRTLARQSDLIVAPRVAAGPRGGVQRGPCLSSWRSVLPRVSWMEFAVRRRQRPLQSGPLKAASCHGPCAGGTLAALVLEGGPPVSAAMLP